MALYIEARQCRKCGEVKALKDFRKRAESPGGIDDICLACNRKMVANYHRRGNKQPTSTAEAFAILRSHGIPCTTGGRIGMPYVDVVAWGCVPIEAKKSRWHDGEQWIWRYTKAQISDSKVDIHILIGEQEGGQIRTFVVPDDVLKSLIPEKAPTFSCVPGSTHGNARQWQTLIQYENRFDIIEQARIVRASALQEAA